MEGTPSLWKEKGPLFSNGFGKEEYCFGAAVRVHRRGQSGRLDTGGFKAWHSLGVNRYSLGIQALDEFFLKTLDRIHSLKEIHHSLDFISSQGYDFSVDFMLGLPFSKERKRDVLKELGQVLEYSPVHLSLYI